MSRLTVFDLLGREVRTLVNEDKHAGYYEANFDASSLASGIYFYKLEAGNFVQTKKMILVKIVLFVNYCNKKTGFISCLFL